MSLALCLLVFLVSGASSPAVFDKEIKVQKTATNKVINKINKQLKNRYKLNAAIQVLARDKDNTIRHLKFTCEDVANLQSGGTCESDNFGLLLIKVPDDKGHCGCSIADRGVEDILTQ